jgi:pimeloyl-ACP methyl ester carboxylesterase
VKPIMLIHGGFHGGWCWDRVRSKLGDSFDVHAPSLIGLSERAAELTDRTDLDTHIQQVIDLLRMNDLRDVVLVGHSYGGAVITGAADREADRLAAIVYLDAFMPHDGESVGGLLAGLTDDGPDVIAIPVPPAEGFGLLEDDARWVQERMTPHPGASIRQPIALGAPRPADSVARRVYVSATRWGGVPHFQETSRELSTDDRWTTIEMDGSHDLMVDRPHQVAELIAELAR